MRKIHIKKQRDTQNLACALGMQVTHLATSEKYPQKRVVTRNLTCALGMQVIQLAASERDGGGGGRWLGDAAHDVLPHALVRDEVCVRL